MIDAGYFPRIVEARPRDLSVPASVVDICSVSTCISEGPSDWIEGWRHNGFGWFNTTADALSVVPPEERSRYRVFGYRLAPQFHREGGGLQPVVLPRDVSPEPIPDAFVSLGFDAVSKFMDSVLGFECSPLSCNAMAAEISTNEHCLLATLEAAEAAAEKFSREQPEPGAYYVVEVFAREREAE